MVREFPQALCRKHTNLIAGTNSREAHQKQKQQKIERKLAKPNANSIQRAKQLWERLRRKSHVEKEERHKLVAELFEIITGHVHDFVFKHDSVRVVQCALKYANEEQRVMIAEELKGHFKVLVESKYGKFLVAKLLVTGTEAVKDVIISEFYGRIRQMINHPEAAWILDDTYRGVANTKQKASMLREWYGPEFAIFKAPKDTTPTADLSTILTETPEKRKPILRYLYDLINQLIQKKMTAFTMLHDAMLQYSLANGSPSSSESATEFIEVLKGDEEGDLLKNLAFTKSGARVICRALAYSGAKDRKLLLRSYKDLMSDLAFDANGMHIILAAYEVIDDTVMTSKTIVSELLGSKLGTDEERYDAVLAQVLHINARIPLLYPLAIGQANAKWLVPADTDTSRLIEEMRLLRTETSKKDPEIRRAELVKGLSEKGTLLATIEHKAKQLVESSFGCQFITEVLLGCEGNKVAAMTAVAELAKGDPTAEGHIAHNSFTGRMLRTLVSGQKFGPPQKKRGGDVKTAAVKSEDVRQEDEHANGETNGDDEKPVRSKPDRLGFAELLYVQIKGHLLAWATGENSFVVANYFDDKGFKEKGDIIKRLRKGRPELQKSSGNGNKGASLLLASM